MDGEKRGLVQKSSASLGHFRIALPRFCLDRFRHNQEVFLWDRSRALEVLGVEEIPFTMMNGNTQGYAKGSQIAINPVAAMPHKTTFHELAHVILGHTTEAVHDSETTPRSLREVEAEAVAMLCLESLGMDGAEFCRGYIQSWLAGATFPERSAQRIFAAADKILKAGIEQSGGAQ